MLKYPEKQPHFPTEGDFWGWIGASRQPTGRSAMAIEMYDRKSHVDPYHFAAKSGDADSNDQRAYLQGLRAVCEAAPNGSAIRVFTRSTYVGDVIKSADQWKMAGWKNSNGHASNTDIIEQYLKVRDERSLAVQFCHCPKKRSEHEAIIEKLLAEAHKLATDE